MEVKIHPAARLELDALIANEKKAMDNAIEKLEVLGDQLPYPHSSAVRGTRLRELRPRGGRSPWRAFYRRIGSVFVIGAVAPERDVDRRGFDSAVRRADRRLRAIEEAE